MERLARPHARPLARVLATVLAVVIPLAACSGDDDDAGGSGTTRATTTAPEVLDILVTNDDGYAAEGIDALVEALGDLPNVKVTVVAPATDSSGTGGKTTEGELAAADQETLSGHPATSVDGFPADTIAYALDVMGLEPDLVVSGVNRGQNLGVITDVSGTVGAARAAAHRGIPSLAVSQGIHDPIDYSPGVDAALTWVRDHRDEVLAFDGPLAEVWSINAPTCAVGRPRAVVEVPTATASTGAEVTGDIDCTVQAPDPTNDVEAFNTGHISLSEVDPDQTAA